LAARDSAVPAVTADAVPFDAHAASAIHAIQTRTPYARCLDETSDIEVDPVQMEPALAEKGDPQMRVPSRTRG
jgi:hypothetical protein